MKFNYIDEICFLLGIIIAFCASFFQAYKFAKIGSDHPVHVFLATVVRESNHRLFTRVPRLLNQSYCGANPLYLHWILSFVSPKHIKLLSYVLNPCMNALQVLIVYSVCRGFPGISDVLSAKAGLVSLLFALNPQFYHAFSARNYGLSSRSIGIILLTIYVLFVFQARSVESIFIYYVAIIVTGCLMWGFNTFSQQAMILFSITTGIIFEKWDLLICFIVSTIVFIVIHPKYSISYIKYTFRFIVAYAKELSAVFVLKIRYSIWRDIVCDIWIKLHNSVLEGLKYAYTNSLVIVLLLNPFAVFCIFIWFNVSQMPLMIRYFMQMALVGIIVFLLTSFRITRFLGEPERYVEFVTFFSTICTTWYLVEYTDFPFAYFIAYFVVVNILQICIVILINRKISGKKEDFALAESIINNIFPAGSVRFCSNSEEYTKRMMMNLWQFVRLWTADQDYAGYKVREAFTQFPYVNKTPFEAALKQYRINICMLDKKNFSTIFEDDREMSSRLELLLETENYILYRLSW